VEPAGVEPASKQGRTVISTCLFCNWFLTGGWSQTTHQTA